MTATPTWSPELTGTFMSVQADAALGLVRIERLPPHFDGAEDLQRCLAEVEQTLARLDNARRGLLLDFKNGPSSNTTSFEEFFLPFLVAAPLPFERAAGLVNTAVGKLQLQRYIRQGRIENLQAFLNERLALAFLL